MTPKGTSTLSGFPQFSPDRLRQARKAAGLSQNGLHVRADVSLDMIKAYEAGRNRPTLDYAARIAYALGVTIDQLCEVAR